MKYVIISKTKARGRDGALVYQVRLAPAREGEQSRRSDAEISIVDTSTESLFKNKDTDDIVEIS